MSWLKKQCVVVPVDFSEDCFKAVDVGREFVEQTSQLHLIHVTRPWSEHEIGGTWGQETEEERLEHIKKVIQEKLQDSDYKDVQTSIHFGSPAVEIASYAEEVDAELIVMPSHGRSGIKLIAMGSVAERVARMAHCPVLVLKKGEKKRQGEKIISYD